MSKNYYKNNVEKVKQRTKVWGEENPEKVREFHKKYREKNKEKARQYRINHAEKIKEIQRKYREKNKEKSKDRLRKQRRELVCLYCHNKFTAKFVYEERTRRFCSLRCASKSKYIGHYYKSEEQKKERKKISDKKCRERVLKYKEIWFSKQRELLTDYYIRCILKIPNSHKEYNGLIKAKRAQLTLERVIKNQISKT